jgi:arginyl-tRNA synthetase
MVSVTEGECLARPTLRRGVHDAVHGDSTTQQLSCSTDMAAIKQRITEEKADWVIYVTDVGQSQHFKAVFKAAQMAGWLPPDGAPHDVRPRVDHVGFGLVLGEDGKRLRTRNATDVRACTAPRMHAHSAPRTRRPHVHCFKVEHVVARAAEEAASECACVQNGHECRACG